MTRNDGPPGVLIAQHRQTAPFATHGTVPLAVAGVEWRRQLRRHATATAIIGDLTNSVAAAGGRRERRRCEQCTGEALGEYVCARCEPNGVGVRNVNQTV